MGEKTFETLDEIADYSMEKSGNIAGAMIVMQDVIHTDNQLRSKFLEAIIRRACYASLHKSIRRKREKILSANRQYAGATKPKQLPDRNEEDNGLDLLADSIIYEYRLVNGKKLGDAMYHDVRAQLSVYRRTLRGCEKKMKFFGEITKRMEEYRQKRVREVLSAEELALMQVKAGI